MIPRALTRHIVKPDFHLLQQVALADGSSTVMGRHYCVSLTFLYSLKMLKIAWKKEIQLLPFCLPRNGYKGRFAVSRAHDFQGVGCFKVHRVNIY